MRPESAGPGGEIAVYQDADGSVRVEARLERDTVWLTQRQISDVFETSAENVLMHLKNIFTDGELEETATAKDFLVVRTEGKRKVRRNLKHYNLDAIISVGYRVNSRRAVRFRQWATGVLRDHLVKGYSVNAARLRDLNQAVRLVADTARRRDLSGVLYLLVKNHAFVDGNKRIAAALLLWFLERNAALVRADGTPRISDGTLVALTLMIAESRPQEKDVLVRIAMHLLHGAEAS